MGSSHSKIQKMQFVRLLLAQWGQKYEKSRGIKPGNFNKEIVLRINLEPLHLLNSFTEKIFALDTKKSNFRKQIRIGRIKTVDLNRSAALALFQKKNHIFQPYFGSPEPIEVKLL